MLKSASERIAHRWIVAQEPLRVGIVGFSGEYGTWSFDPKLARALVRDQLLQLHDTHTGRVIEVVSGLTDLGIPKLAYEEASKLGMITVGFAPDESKEHPHHHVDKIVYMGAGWGDESSAFLDYIDVLVKVGGGPQSEAEFDAFQGPKHNVPLERM